MEWFSKTCVVRMLGRRLTAVWRLVVLACSAIEGYFIAAIQRTALASGLRPDAVHFKAIVSICVFLYLYTETLAR